MGFDVVIDFVFFVMCSMEDFVIWVDLFKIKWYVLEYNEECDDFDLEV